VPAAVGEAVAKVDSAAPAATLAKADPVAPEAAAAKADSAAPEAAATQARAAEAKADSGDLSTAKRWWAATNGDAERTFVKIEVTPAPHGEPLAEIGARHRA
jgi:hypothetical protein